MSGKTIIVKGEPSVTRGVCIPVKLLRKAEEEARRKGVSVNSVIVEALRLYFEMSPFFSDRKALETLYALASARGTSEELERLVKALSEELEKEKRVKSGG